MIAVERHRREGLESVVRLTWQTGDGLQQRQLSW